MSANRRHAAVGKGDKACDQQLKLGKAVGTVKDANHAEPEWIGIDNRFTQRVNAFVQSRRITRER